MELDDQGPSTNEAAAVATSTATTLGSGLAPRTVRGPSRSPRTGRGGSARGSVPSDRSWRRVGEQVERELRQGNCGKPGSERECSEKRSRDQREVREVARRGRGGETATGSVKTVSRRPRGDPPTLSSSVPGRRSARRRTPGHDNETAVRLHATPPAAMTAPTRTRPRPSAYQTPSAAIVSPTSSPVLAARTAHTANGRAGRRRGTRRRRARTAAPGSTGWNTSTTAHAVHGYARYASARSAAARSEAKCCARARTAAAHPTRSPKACTATRVRGDGTTIQSGASSARMGST